MLAAICSSGRNIPYVLPCNRGPVSIPSEEEQEQEFIALQQICIGYPADAVKQGVNGTVFEGGIDDTYPREIAHDLFRRLCLEFTKYLKECQDQFDKFVEFVGSRLEAAQSLFETPDNVIDFFSLSSVSNVRIFDEYIETLMPKRQKKRRNAEPVEDDEISADELVKQQLAESVQQACLASLCKLRAYTEVCEKDTIDGSKQAYRIREVAVILRPACVVCKDFNDMLYGLCMKNVAERDAPAEPTGRKRPKKTAPEATDILEVLGVITKRKLRTENFYNGHEDWFHFCRTLIGPSVLSALQAVTQNDPEVYAVLRHPNGLWRENIGPWCDSWKQCDKLRPLCIENVMSLRNEISKLNYAESTAPAFLRHPLQLDPLAYTNRPCASHYDVINLSKPFDDNPEQMRRCVFLLDFFDCTLTDRSHIDDISFLCMWQHLEEIETRKTCAVDTELNLHKELVAPDPVHELCIASDKTRIAKVRQTVFKGTEVVDRTDTEKDKLAEKYTTMLQTEQLRIQQLRDCQGDPEAWISNSRGEMAQDAINSYIGADGITAKAIHHIFKNVIMDESVCESVRHVLCFGVTPGNGLASSKTVRRWFSGRFAPDMSESCNTLQKFMWLYEKLGVAHLHRAFLFMHQAALDSMIPHDGMFVNCLVYGGADCGKSFALDLLQRLMIEGSFITEQHMTDAAHRCHEGPQEMQVRAIHEVADHLEKPNNGRSQTRDDPSSSRQDALKSELTENLNITTTPMPGLMEHGKRQNLKYKKKVLRANMAGGNLSDPWSQVASAVLSRFFPIAAVQVA